MTIHQVETLEVHKGCSVIRRPSGIHHAHNGETEIMAMPGGISVGWEKLIPKPYIHFFRDS